MGCKCTKLMKCFGSDEDASSPCINDATVKVDKQAPKQPYWAPYPTMKEIEKYFIDADVAEALAALDAAIAAGEEDGFTLDIGFGSDEDTSSPCINDTTMKVDKQAPNPAYCAIYPTMEEIEDYIDADVAEALAELDMAIAPTLEEIEEDYTDADVAEALAELDMAIAGGEEDDFTM